MLETPTSIMIKCAYFIYTRHYWQQTFEIKKTNLISSKW